MNEIIENNNVENEPLVVTSIAQLKSYANGELVELPPFAQGQPFVARLKRPSLFKLVKCGKIPNSLVVQANKLFTGGTASVRSQAVNEDMMDGLFAILDVVCEDSLVEPTYKQVRDAGLDLTDQQKMFVFNYSQNGVEALSSFR